MSIWTAPTLLALTLMASPSRPEDMGQSDSDELCEKPSPWTRYPPFGKAVRAALSASTWGRNVHLRNHRILQQQIRPPRFYSMIGVARQVETQVRCTVATDRGTQEVDLNIVQLQLYGP